MIQENLIVDILQENFRLVATNLEAEVVTEDGSLVELLFHLRINWRT